MGWPGSSESHLDDMAALVERASRIHDPDLNNGFERLGWMIENFESIEMDLVDEDDK